MPQPPPHLPPFMILGMHIPHAHVPDTFLKLQGPGLKLSGWPCGSSCLTTSHAAGPVLCCVRLFVYVYI